MGTLPRVARCQTLPPAVKSRTRASSKGCKVYRASCSLSVASDSLARGPLALKPYGVRSSLHFIYALKRTAPSQTLCVFPVFFKLRSGITLHETGTAHHNRLHFKGNRGRQATPARSPSRWSRSRTAISFDLERSVARDEVADEGSEREHLVRGYVFNHVE